MTQAEKRVLWRKRIHAFRASGLSGAAWCRQQQVHYKQFLYWLARIEPAVAVEETVVMPQWLALSLAAETTDVGATQTYRDQEAPSAKVTEPGSVTGPRGGRTCYSVTSPISLRVGAVVVDVHPGFDKQVLADVVQLLVVASC